MCDLSPEANRFSIWWSLEIACVCPLSSVLVVNKTYLQRRGSASERASKKAVETAIRAAMSRIRLRELPTCRPTGISLADTTNLPRASPKSVTPNRYYDFNSNELAAQKRTSTGLNASASVHVTRGFAKKPLFVAAFWFAIIGCYLDGA